MSNCGHLQCLQMRMGCQMQGQGLVSDPYNHHVCMKSYRALEAERDRLKAELEMFTKNQRSNVLLMNENDFLHKDRDAWKSKAEKLAATLLLIRLSDSCGEDQCRELAKAALDEYSQAHGVGEGK